MLELGECIPYLIAMLFGLCLAGCVVEIILSQLVHKLDKVITPTVSQNNGVIQMTGVASRHVDLYIAPLLIILCLFPVIGSMFLLIPKPVLGGATVILFGTIAVAGNRILATQEIDNRKVYIVAISFELGLGVTVVPDATQHMPAFLKQVIATSITLAGLSAIVLPLILLYVTAQKAAVTRYC